MPSLNKAQPTNNILIIVITITTINQPIRQMHYGDNRWRKCQGYLQPNNNNIHINNNSNINNKKSMLTNRNSISVCMAMSRITTILRMIVLIKPSQTTPSHQAQNIFRPVTNAFSKINHKNCCITTATTTTATIISRTQAPYTNAAWPRRNRRIVRWPCSRRKQRWTKLYNVRSVPTSAILSISSTVKIMHNNYDLNQRSSILTITTTLATTIIIIMLVAHSRDCINNPSIYNRKENRN